jgi:PAS domain S-box-containing protein
MRHKRVNLHTHTLFSDGTLTPEGLVDLLVTSGVRYASLTDHDTVAGLDRFSEALHRANIGFIPGVEITSFHKGLEFHLLAYGFDPENQELNILLDTIRQSKPVETHGVAHNLRNSSNTSSNGFKGLVGIDQVIRIIHQAGGLAFLAHPLESCGDLASVSRWLGEFSGMGLDGLEARYGAYPQPQQQELASLAEEYGLLTCGGTDFHDNTAQSINSHVVVLPELEWSKFLKAVLRGMTQSTAQTARASDSPAQQVRSPRRFRRRYYILRIVLPVLFTIALFTSALWGFILPAFEDSLLDRKREMISELTYSAWSILAAYERNERDGLLTREEAQQQALVQIQAMRYGKEGKDYFWLQDMTPRIIMHPYRTDLIGQDVSNFQDPMGVRIFVEFSNLVRQKDEGYIKYVWQWKDDPSRLEAKESFVKGFEPWGWIIGTGLYIEDVEAEIARIETRIVNIALIITGSLVVLLLFIAAQGIQVEKKRLEAEAGLRESTEKFRSLVEAATEGVLLVLGNRCRYANSMLLELLGYSAHQLELLDLEDVLPRTGENEPAWKLILDMGNEKSFDGFLLNAVGGLIECALTVSPITAEGHQGQVFTIRPIGIDQENFQSNGEQLWKLGEVAQNATVGIFRAKPSRRGSFVELNTYGIELYKKLVDADPSHPGLESFFQTASDFESFLEDLYTTSEPVVYSSETNLREGGTLSFTIRAVLLRNDNGEPAWIDGMIVETTEFHNALRDNETRYRQLENQLAFLFKPLTDFKDQLLTCPLDTSVAAAAKIMGERGSSSIIVTTQSGSPLGIVTDHDIRARLVSKKLSVDTPIHRIMSAPVHRVHAKERVYKALMEMEERGIKYLAVENDYGKIINLIEADQLLLLKDYGIKFAAREILDCNNLEDVVKITGNLAEQVRIMLDRDDDPIEISRLVTSIADAATEKIIDLCVSELGNPPCDFCFMVVGSQGRREMTLGSDQDNAIIYGDPDSEVGKKSAEKYFQNLGRIVSDGLHQAGFPYCQGQIMASNPKWVLPLRSWESVFRDWIVKAEPQELLDFCIFFDLRGVYGAVTLVDELVGSIKNMLKDQPIFFTHMARNLLQQRPAAVETGTPGELGQETWNIKSYMLPFNGFARLYALQQNIQETNTLIRLERLAEAGILHQNSQRAYTASLTFLIKKRFAYQVSLQTTENNLAGQGLPHHLNEADIQQLRDTNDHVNLMLKRVSQDFLGGMQP